MSIQKRAESLIIIQWDWEDLEYEEFNCYTSIFVGYGCNFQVWFRWKERKAKEEISFLFCVSKEDGKKWKISSLTAIFLKWKDQKCDVNFDFSFLHFASNEINQGARKLISIFNFHWRMKIEWTKGTRTAWPIVNHLLLWRKFCNLARLLGIIRL